MTPRTAKECPVARSQSKKAAADTPFADVPARTPEYRGAPGGDAYPSTLALIRIACHGSN